MLMLLMSSKGLGFLKKLITQDNKNILYPVIQKFTSDDINLSPYPVKDDQGNIHILL